MAESNGIVHVGPITEEALEKLRQEHPDSPIIEFDASSPEAALASAKRIREMWKEKDVDPITRMRQMFNLGEAMYRHDLLPALERGKPSDIERLVSNYMDFAGKNAVSLHHAIAGIVILFAELLSLYTKSLPTEEDKVIVMHMMAQVHTGLIMSAGSHMLAINAAVAEKQKNKEKEH